MIKFSNLEQVKELMCDAEGNFNSNQHSVELFTNKAGKQIYVATSFCPEGNNDYEKLMEALENEYQEEYLVYLESEIDLILAYVRVIGEIKNKKERIEHMAWSFANSYEIGNQKHLIDFIEDKTLFNEIEFLQKTIINLIGLKRTGNL